MTLKEMPSRKSSISQDDEKPRCRTTVQKLTDRHVGRDRSDQLAEKEKELMQV